MTVPKTTPKAKHPQQKNLDFPRIEIYTDGASLGNPGPAGIGVIILYGGQAKEISEGLGETTNNVAELTAILRGLEEVQGTREEVVVYSDSTYAIGVVSKNWKAKANTDLVLTIRQLAARFANLHFEKVEGHAGVEWNERADELANQAASSLKV